jgi:glycosyltransferase involved in cell wall biosynthesis
MNTPINKPHRIALSVNAAWNVVNFRAGLVRGLQAAGHEVMVIAPDDGHADAVRALGARFVPIELDRKGRNPVQELKTLWRYRQVLQRERPDAYLGFTIKPNIYGGLACHQLGIPVINNIAGLGTVFGKRNAMAMLVRGLYRQALKRSKRVLFQNDDDQALFLDAHIVQASQCRRIPGSGVDLAHFAPVALPSEQAPDAPVRFLLSARLLWDKGVGDYVEASRLLRERGVPCECLLLGMLDAGNPGAIAQTQIDDWHQSGLIRYLGSTRDVRVPVATADCMVLPSTYREGVPRALLEAASMARPLIATNATGCRDALDDGITGFLVKASSPTDLADKMMAICRMSSAERTQMGRRGRAKMESQFDEQIVVRQYLQDVAAVLA